MSRRRAEAIVRCLGVRAGEAVLVHGGAGGVGSFAVRIAKAAGARVLATAGPDDLETLTRLGANVAADTRARARQGAIAVDLRAHRGRQRGCSLRRR